MQDSSSKCFGSSKISRICLVDLAGFERNIPDNASRQHVKEGKYIKKSMSQLGYASSFEFGSDHGVIVKIYIKKEAWFHNFELVYCYLKLMYNLQSVQALG